MSETPEKKKARLRYDNVFKTAWTDEFHFIKHSRKGNKFAFCEFCRTATEPFCVLLNFFLHFFMVLSSCGTVALDGLFIHLFLWSSKKNE